LDLEKENEEKNRSEEKKMNFPLRPEFSNKIVVEENYGTNACCKFLESRKLFRN